MSVFDGEIKTVTSGDSYTIGEMDFTLTLDKSSYSFSVKAKPVEVVAMQKAQTSIMIRREQILDARNLSAADSTGAGDAFIGYFVERYSRTNSRNLSAPV